MNETGMARRATMGDSVRIHYTGTLRDGSVFDSSVGREPLEFTVGSGTVIAGFDRAVAGMRVGERKSVSIPAEQAYGERRDDLVRAVPRETFPDHLEPSVGDRLQMGQPGRTMVVTVRDVSDAHVVLDANHPLAGEELTFALELVGIG